jgi:SAM-dependent methyltransferase
MCNKECVRFVEETVKPDDVKDRDVIEIGSYDVNGSVRPYLEGLGPASYVGVDINPGPGVDVVCNAEELVERFGTERFDLVVSTELLEHVRDWRAVISTMKRIVRPGGLIVITTRSQGFPIHGFPDDFWRYEASDMRVIFGDCYLEAVDVDRSEPGVFVAARRPPSQDFEPFDLSGYALRSPHTDRRILTVDGDSPDDERARLVAELAALRATKTFRYTIGLRAMYTRIRRLATLTESKPRLPWR